MREISLNGRWQFEPRARVVLKPGGVLEESTEALPPAGEMQLPMNWELRGLPSFDGRVRFWRSFDFDGLQDNEQHVHLVFKGVDYFARVWLNDREIGTHAGYFQPFRFDITDTIRTGQNTIVVEVTCPREEPETLWPDRKVLIKGILSHWDCRPGSWDMRTGQERNSGGIWNDVYLETRSAASVEHIRVTTKLVPRAAPAGYEIGLGSVNAATEASVDAANAARQAVVLVDAEVHGPPGDYQLTVRLGDEPPVSLPITLACPNERHTVAIQVTEPRLWWTWDLGEPHLETLVVQLEQGRRELCRRTLEIGLREIFFDPESGQWWLNGIRVFVRGTNVVPTLWLGEYDEAMIARDIQLLRDAHINGVRVCVHVNRDEFYTACDRAGILVWQDFALQWGYSEDPAFVGEAVRQIKDMVRMLGHHPSIALWCCQNESSFHNKYILDPVLAAAVAAEDGSRYVRPTSEFTEHTYVGWYSRHYRDYSALPATPVLTEFGAQALPDLASLRAVVGASWPPDWDRMAYHDFQYDQTFHVASVDMGETWEQFVQNSQAYQAQLLKFAIERYRQAKYTALGGMFQFMFVDCWPAITWSVVGYDRTPKQGYLTLQCCYQPILIGCNLERETMIVGTDRGGHPRPLILTPWVTNDRHQSFPNCTYRARISGPGGQFDFTAGEPFEVPSDGVITRLPALICDLPASLDPGPYLLELELVQAGDVLSYNCYNVTVAMLP